MVLEYLVEEKQLENRFFLALALGAIYSLIGIFLARLIFGASSGIAAVIFASILLIPSMRKMFSHEQRVEEREQRFIWKHFIKDNEKLIKAYLGIFVGVYIAFFLYTVIAANAGQDIFRIFPEQLAGDALSGKAFSTGLFLDILENNFVVLLVCFLLSVLSGSGAIFFVVWNASLWAVIFGARSFAAAGALEQSVGWVSVKLIAVTAPHVFFEGMSYILAGIAGAVISKDVLLEKQGKQSFITWFVVIMATFFAFTLGLKALGIEIFFLFKIGFFLLLLYFLRETFQYKKHQEVFIYNYWLFIIAIIFFLIGAVIEIGVLTNSELLNDIYAAASNHAMG